MDQIGDHGLLASIEPRHSASALVLIEPGILELLPIGPAVRGKREQMHGLLALELMEPDANSLREILGGQIGADAAHGKELLTTKQLGPNARPHPLFRWSHGEQDRPQDQRQARELTQDEKEPTWCRGPKDQRSEEHTSELQSHSD